MRARIGVSDATIRLSIGIDWDDLVADLAQALVGGVITAPLSEAVIPVHLL